MLGRFAQKTRRWTEKPLSEQVVGSSEQDGVRKSAMYRKIQGAPPACTTDPCLRPDHTKNPEMTGNIGGNTVTDVMATFCAVPVESPNPVCVASSSGRLVPADQSRRRQEKPSRYEVGEEGQHHRSHEQRNVRDRPGTEPNDVAVGRADPGTECQK